jgi:hypothetical protein
MTGFSPLAENPSWLMKDGSNAPSSMLARTEWMPRSASLSDVVLSLANIKKLVKPSLSMALIQFSPVWIYSLEMIVKPSSFPLCIVTATFSSSPRSNTALRSRSGLAAGRQRRRPHEPVCQFSADAGFQLNTRTDRGRAVKSLLAARSSGINLNSLAGVAPTAQSGRLRG